MAIIINRRQFLKWATASAAALGLSQTDLLKLQEAFAVTTCGCEDFADPFYEDTIAPHVIWFQGQSCGGCTLSILNRMRTNFGDPTPLGGANGVVQDVVDLLVGDAVGFLTKANPPSPYNRSGWAPFPKGYITLDYQTEVMASAGGQWKDDGVWNVSPDDIGDYIKCLAVDSNTRFVLAISGSIPARDRLMLTRTSVGGPFAAQPFCVAGSFNTGDVNGKCERSIVEILEWLGPRDNCLAILAFGTCASWGGIPGAHGNITQATSVYNYLVNIKHHNIGSKIVNIPGCAPHPDWMIYPAAWAYLYLLGAKTTLTPPLDTSMRKTCVWKDPTHRALLSVPKNTCRDIYTGDKGYTVFCEVCPKYSESNLCNDLGAGQGTGDGTFQKEWCTRPEGCNGFIASPDCPTRRWNNFDIDSTDSTTDNRNQWCVGNLPCGPNYVCQGCAEVDFPDGRSPFFSATKGYPWSWTP
jgi:Ni,Fe-hydrogenase I small subunit